MRRSRARLPSLVPGRTPLRSMKAAQVSTMHRSSAKERSVRLSGMSQTRTVSPRYWREKRRSTQ
eukprot:3995313-Lingulodinium_polyedra.AAC.1